MLKSVGDRARINHRISAATAVLAVVFGSGFSGMAFAAPEPPAGRAYEKVSPADKNGLDVLPNNGQAAGTQSSASGDAIAWASFGSFAGNPSNLFPAQYASHRGAGSWSTAGISPPGEGTLLPNTSAVVAVADNFDKAVVQTSVPLTPGAPIADPFGTPPLYLYDLSDGTYTLLTPEPLAGAPFYSPNFIGASSDFSHILFEADAELTPDAVGVSGVKLYEWVDGTLSLASVLPGTPETPAQGSGGSGSTGDGELIDNAISADGSKIFFTSPTDDTGQLYFRQNGTTVFVNEEENSLAAVPPGPAVFRGATPDGSTVFFTSRQQLVDEDTNDPTSDDGDDLYAYDTTRPASDPDNLTLLSVDSEPDGDPGSEVAGVLGASDDGSLVYFAAGGELVDGAPAPAGMHLYAWDDGVVKYIATVESVESLLWTGTEDSRRLNTVSAEGDRMLFVTPTQVTAYDNTNPDCGVSNRCDQVLLYDAGDSTPSSPALTCISCDPDGDPPTGHASLYAFATQQHARLAESREPRNLSADGSRAYFESPDALVGSRDTNGRYDVYVWEGGSASLISTGRNSFDSRFADASANGDNVFFATQERLTGWDNDDLYDLYDARVGGGLPEPPPPPPGECVGDQCQGQPSGRPLLQEPGSAALVGPGDSSPAPRGAFSARRLTKAQRAKLARGRRVLLRVRVNQAGRVSVVAHARLGKRKRVVGRSTRRARRRGVVRVPFRLSARARRRLANDRDLRVELTIRFSRSRERTTMTTMLRGR